MRKLIQGVATAAAIGTGGLLASGAADTASAQDNPNCSVWIVESSRFMDVPMGSFMPDRAFVPGNDSPMHSINTVDLPDNVGVIKCGSELMLFDSGWKQTNTTR